MPFSSLLEYESNVFMDVMAEDSLLVTARGLGLDRLLLKTIYAFCQPDQLVIVLNTWPGEQQFFIEELAAEGVEHLPRVITSEGVSTKERELLYRQGGVFFVTSRILVVDMLTKRLPVEYVAGIIVHRAHKVGESSQESFILRMFREANSEGFIKGFSDSPMSFSTGFAQVERVMRRLFVRKLLLRPRFHAEVSACLERNKPDVVEIGVGLTMRMSHIQHSLMDLIELSLRELRKSAIGVYTEEFTLENSLTKTFDKVLKMHLDPQWNQLNQKTKNLVADLKILRTLLAYLTQYDCVTFYNFLQSLRANVESQNSIWMFMDAANSVFVNAKARIYQIGKNEKSKENIDIEPNPKWEALLKILKEIEEANKESAGNVLVCASDERTCYQLRQVLCSGVKETLQNLYDGSLEFLPEGSISGKRKAEKKSTPKETEDSGEIGVKVLQNYSVVLHPLHGSADPYSLLRKLYELQPKYVVLYDASMDFVRQLEVFKASQAEQPLRVYFLVFSDSVEEQRYLTNLRKEKDAFEMLIRQKADMVIPEERQGRSEVARNALRGTPGANESSRKAGGAAASSTKRIVVDMREFRSELPSLIHKHGIDIEPVTLEVGDYILSPELCVERKSVSDLVGSLKNGRLYTQCVAMTRFYKRSVLLIEFEEGKSFSLQGKSSLKSEVSLANISSKLSLLTIHFPQLRIIWSESPRLTAEIFEDLKSGSAEPDAETAAAIGVDGALANDTAYNVTSFDMLQKFPGINSKNCRQVANKYKTVHDLVTNCHTSLADLIQNKALADKLCEFVSKEQAITQNNIKKKKRV